MERRQEQTTVWRLTTHTQHVVCDDGTAAPSVDSTAAPRDCRRVRPGGGGCKGRGRPLTLFCQVSRITLVRSSPYAGPIMADLSDKACAERLRTALDLADSGIQMRRSQLRRAYPDESAEEIRARLDRWLLEREDAPYGDAIGRRVDPETVFSS